jgi:hypothetical protein
VPNPLEEHVVKRRGIRVTVQPEKAVESSAELPPSFAHFPIVGLAKREKEKEGKRRYTEVKRRQLTGKFKRN